MAALGAYPAAQKKYWKELVIFGVLLLMGFGLSFLMVLGVQFPYIADIISQFFKSLLHI